MRACTCGFAPEPCALLDDDLTGQITAWARRTGGRNGKDGGWARGDRTPDGRYWRGHC
jgi:hypothetical protein